MRTIRIAMVLARAALRSEIQYRSNFLMMAAGVVYQCTGFAFIWVILARFGSIGGWSVGEVAFLFGMRLCAHGLWVAPFHRLTDLDAIIREGELDRFLVRPLNLLVQLLTSKLWLGSFGDIAGGVVILSAASAVADIRWSPGSVFYLALALAGGALVEVAVQLAAAALTFRILSTKELREMIDDVFNTFGSYPLKIYGTSGQFLLTFVLPLAFVAYLPATVLLGRTEELEVAAAVAYMAPLVGVACFCLAYLFWCRQLRHYQSAGH